jgi:hypothetical protein
MGRLSDVARSRWRVWSGLRCSFCGRRSDDVARLVAGASAHICDECITKCVAVLEQHGGFTPASQPDGQAR